MKKTVFLILALIMTFSFVGCSTDPNKADTSLESDEISIRGTVVKAEENYILLEDEKGSQYSFGYTDKTEVVEYGYYVVDLSADSFLGKEITVIAASEIRETYPMGIDVRMIIFE